MDDLHVAATTDSSGLAGFVILVVVLVGAVLTYRNNREKVNAWFKSIFRRD